MGAHPEPLVFPPLLRKTSGEERRIVTGKSLRYQHRPLHAGGTAGMSEVAHP